MELFEAVEEGDLELVRELVENFSINVEWIWKTR